jgi:SnoaL-like domain
VTARIALAALALFAASSPLRAQHAEHAENVPAESTENAERCSGADCPMHAAKHGASAEHAGGGMHGAMHGEGGMHAEHVARHAAIDRLVATLDIQQLKARYMRCIDTKDLACLRDTVFTPDSELYFKGGDYEIAVKGWPEIEKFYQGAFTPQKFGMHNVHTPEITVSGDTATGLWYLHDVFINLEESWTLQGSALYHDDYVRVNGEWRIAKSAYQRLWEETTPRSKQTKLGSKPVRE